jgi:hypothetical protein
MIGSQPTVATVARTPGLTANNRVISLHGGGKPGPALPRAPALPDGLHR